MGNTIPTNLPKELRLRQTEAEKILWFKLRNRQMEGVKFRRQQHIESYIVDFVSFEKKLIIEIDGGHHNEVQTQEKDNRRTRWLEGKGYHVLRFWNNDVLNNTEGVLENIKMVPERKFHPHTFASLSAGSSLSHRGRGMNETCRKINTFHADAHLKNLRTLKKSGLDSFITGKRYW